MRPVQVPFVVDPANRGLRARKAFLREELRHRRRVIPADLQNTTRWKVANQLRALIAQLAPGGVIGLYYPQGNEIDLRDFAYELRAGGQAVALPRVVSQGLPLVYNLWPECGLLELDEAGIPAATGPEVWPTILVLPMLGYHRKGWRLGSGGGFYDKTLKTLPLPIITVGVCQTELEITDFPNEYADVRLDYIITGKETILCV